MGKALNIVGQRFGRLVVLIEVQRVDPIRRRYLCVCDCGARIEVNQTHLTTEHTQSCGCLQGDMSSISDSGFKSLLGRYKGGAKRRNLSWELTEEEFKKLTQSPCYYTGRLPSQKVISYGSHWRNKRSGLPPRDGGVYIYNGVDRLDSSKGYTLENCVACCEDANMAKQSLSHNKFIELCREVANKHPKVQQ